MLSQMTPWRSRVTESDLGVHSVIKSCPAEPALMLSGVARNSLALSKALQKTSVLLLTVEF